MTLPKITVDPKLDLVLERELDVPVELVWRAWTTAEHLRHWFVPKPWTITACELDVRPGGAMNFTMRSPEGQEFPNSGCYLEVKPFERLVTTDTLFGGYRPSPSMARKPAAASMRKWASTTAGARSFRRWWTTSRQVAWPAEHGSELPRDGESGRFCRPLFNTVDGVPDCWRLNTLLMGV